MPSNMLKAFDEVPFKSLYTYNEKMKSTFFVDKETDTIKWNTFPKSHT